METKLSIRLKTLRKITHLSTDEVIERLKNNNLDYSSQSLYKWEQGNAVPSVKTLYVLAKIYQCNISYLIAENDVEFKKVNSYEMTILRLYRSDFLFRSTISQLIRFIDKTKG